VGLGTPTVVRLEGALAHVKTPSSVTTSRRCRTPPYQNAAEQPLDPTQGGDAGQLYPGSARRQPRSSPGASSSFCAGRESFPAHGRFPCGVTVVASATSLLACPFAGHQCSVHTTTHRPKTGQAGESFATVSLSNRAVSGSGKSPTVRPGSDRRRVHRLWITCGQPLAPSAFTTLNVVLDWGEPSGA
jgi:hypothetical protein